jgi:uncharacterized membrane protein YccC
MIQRIFTSPLSQYWPQCVLAARNTAAALCALAIAVYLQLESPYWAAMTTLIVIQPTRGQVFEKSFYRLVGTTIGSAAGLLLLRQTASPLLLTVALALWIAGCVGIGNLLHGLRSYACLMAGLTCTVISMSGYLNPPHLYRFAFGRMADVFIGVIVATIMTAIFTPRRSSEELMNRLRGVSVKVVVWLSRLLREKPAGQLVRLEQEILIEIAEIEGLLDVVGAASLSFKKTSRLIRGLISSLLSLLAAGHLAAGSLGRYPEPVQQSAPWQELLARRLDEVADTLASGKSVNCLAELFKVVAEAKVAQPRLGEALTDIVLALQRVLTASGRLVVNPDDRPLPTLVRSHDACQARRAALRAVLAITATGTIWSLSGWTQGPMMLMGISIMISLFSNKDHPVAFVGQIFIGAVVGSIIAIFCRLVLLPGITDPLTTTAILAPFLFLGIFSMSQRRMAIAATDATLIFMLVSQPGMSSVMSSHDLVLGAVALILGVGSAWLAYRYLLPISPAIRMNSLLIATARDMEALAAGGEPEVTGKLKSRIQSRVVRLVALAKQYDSDPLRLVEVGLAVLAICRSIQLLQRALKDYTLSPRAARQCSNALCSLTHLTRRPQDVLTLLSEESETSRRPVPAGSIEGCSDDLTVAEILRNTSGLLSRTAKFWEAPRQSCLV